MKRLIGAILILAILVDQLNERRKVARSIAQCSSPNSKRLPVQRFSARVVHRPDQDTTKDSQACRHISVVVAQNPLLDRKRLPAGNPDPGVDSSRR